MSGHMRMNAEVGCGKGGVLLQVVLVLVLGV